MTAAIFGLWRNWIVAVGLLMVLAVLAPIVPRHLLAPVNILFYIVLQIVHSELRKRDEPSCSRLIQQVSVVMIVTAVALILLYFLGRGENVYEITGQPYDINSPVIVILITAPVASLVTLSYWLNRREPAVCQRCKLRYGNVIEHGFVGDLFRREWRYQTSMLFVLSFVLTVVDWGYYLIYYVNTNLNRADLFFFIWMPLSMYVVSLIYLGIRYYSLWMYYCRNDEGHYVEKPGVTTLRYLILSCDRLFLNGYDAKLANGAKVRRFDSPVVINTPYHERENTVEADRLFKKETGLNSAELKLAYSSPDTVTYHNMFHYFAFLPDTNEIGLSNLEGEWFTWGNLTQMASKGLLSSDVASELKRIYDISMAWKTYDEYGRRLYNIKHYRPTFRLRDIHSWDVDFNDHKWLDVSRHNEDKFWYPLWRLFFGNERKHRG